MNWWGMARIDTMDKFKDECGVFGVCDSQDAANIAYLGLYALQHRGQESAGIAASDGATVGAGADITVSNINITSSTSAGAGGGGGVGVRAGVNAGYLSYSKERNWIPF